MKGKGITRDSRIMIGSVKAREKGLDSKMAIGLATTRDSKMATGKGLMTDSKKPTRLVIKMGIGKAKGSVIKKLKPKVRVMGFWTRK